MGRSLIQELLHRGYTVRALVRAGSEKKLPSACIAIAGNALDCSTYRRHVNPAHTFVHLVGVSHPNPGKAAQFRAVDLVSARAAITAACENGVQHFIYVSVAHPAPVMRAYIAVRMECEALLRTSGLNATILRPWYVLGPGHLWAYALLPGYWLMERFERTRESAQRLGLVRLRDMVRALVASVENPCRGIRIYQVPEIRQFGRLSEA